MVSQVTTAPANTTPPTRTKPNEKDVTETP
jgi:hypothetical protein